MGAQTVRSRSSVRNGRPIASDAGSRPARRQLGPSGNCLMGPRRRDGRPRSVTGGMDPTRGHGVARGAGAPANWAIRPPSLCTIWRVPTKNLIPVRCPLGPEDLGPYAPTHLPVEEHQGRVDSPGHPRPRRMDPVSQILEQLRWRRPTLRPYDRQLSALCSFLGHAERLLHGAMKSGGERRPCNAPDGHDMSRPGISGGVGRITFVAVRNMPRTETTGLPWHEGVPS
jgi:hypothetical protein